MALESRHSFCDYLTQRLSLKTSQANFFCPSVPFSLFRDTIQTLLSICGLYSQFKTVIKNTQRKSTRGKLSRHSHFFESCPIFPQCKEKRGKNPTFSVHMQKPGQFSSRGDLLLPMSSPPTPIAATVPAAATFTTASEFIGAQTDPAVITKASWWSWKAAVAAAIVLGVVVLSGVIALSVIAGTQHRQIKTLQVRKALLTEERRKIIFFSLTAKRHNLQQLHRRHRFLRCHRRQWRYH